MKKLLYIFLLPLFVAMQCEKEDTTETICNGDDLQCELSKLPPISSTGEGTFACLLNGKAWLSKAGNSTFIAHRPAYDAEYFKGQLRIDGKRYLNNEIIDAIDINIFEYSAKDSAKIIIGNEKLGKTIYGVSRSQCSFDSFNSEFNGEINILRFDSINRVVAGTFKFTTYLVKEDRDGNFEDCGDTLRFTNGRFDIAY